MEIPNANELNFGRNDFSVSVWLKYGVQPSQYAAIFIKSGVDIAPWTGISFFVDTPSPGEVMFRIDANNYVDTGSVLNVRYNDNTFRHFVLIRGNNNLQIFVNGAMVAQKTVNSIDVSNSREMVLGANHTNRKIQNYSGVMENLRFYNRALIVGEVLQLYQSGQ